MKTKSISFRVSPKQLASGVMSILLILFNVTVFGQDGSAGINEATDMINGYFEDGAGLMYAICAIAGLVGAIKVYQKWNAGEHDTARFASAWFGSCVFAVVVVSVIKSFFGI